MQTTQKRSGRAAVRLGLPHVLMVAAGLATFLLVASVLRDRTDTTQVWIVSSDVAAGSLVAPENLVPLEISSDESLLASLTPVADGVPEGRVRDGLTAGEPLLASDLVPDDQSVSGRTFTIPIDTIVLDGLGLLRGDRLDVIGAGADGSMRYVVSDVEVMRLPSVSGSSAFSSASSRSSWVTVEVDEQEALLLSAALDRGEVELVRSTGALAISSPTVVEKSDS